MGIRWVCCFHGGGSYMVGRDEKEVWRRGLLIHIGAYYTTFYSSGDAVYSFKYIRYR